MPEYWVELAKVQAASGSYGDAYHSLTRAYELDRGNHALLRSLTELALRGGDPSLAQVHARELEIVAPQDTWVKLTRGYVAIRQARYDDAQNAAEDLLEASPHDPDAKVLKARALLGKGLEAEAVELLLEQVRVQPSDGSSLFLLARIYERRQDWSRLALIAGQLRRLLPADTEQALLFIRASFRARQFEEARRVSGDLLRKGAEPAVISRVLDVWLEFWPGPQRVLDAFKLGAQARGYAQRVAFADFLNRAGSPQRAHQLVAHLAGTPVGANNADANALLGVALAARGKTIESKKRFDAVLAFDPGNAIALRGRSALFLQTGDTDEAVADAVKLVSVLPKSARDRLLLARAYRAAGNPEEAQRTLWEAFQAIPANEEIYSALMQMHHASPEKRHTLRDEFARQNLMKLNRGLL